MGSGVSSIVAVDAGRVVFAASDGVHGVELSAGGEADGVQLGGVVLVQLGGVEHVDGDGAGTAVSDPRAPRRRSASGAGNYACYTFPQPGRRRVGSRRSAQRSSPGSSSCLHRSRAPARSPAPEVVP
jgi:hypothetical protein